MANCLYCRFSGMEHDDACPESMSGDEKKQAKEVWVAGYHMGRSGDERPTIVHSPLILGHLRGVVALEEAQNGEPFFSSDDLEDWDKSLDNLDDDPYEPDTIRR